jgi:cytochrome b
VVLIAAAFITIYTGAIEWHFRVGYAVLTLLLFRILWGFAGPRYARFASFTPTPAALLAYLRKPHTPHAGHSPVGALSVYAMLSAVLTQAMLGLFANDGSYSEGPWARFVAGATSDWLTRLHKWNQWLIAGLIGLHLAAIVYYLLRKHDNLVPPMVHGRRRGVIAEPTHDDARTRLGAVLFLALSAGLVTYLVKL